MKKRRRNGNPSAETSSLNGLHRPEPDDCGADVFESLVLERSRDVYLPPSGPWPDDPTDMVHDVRVASRRLVEALDLARPLLKPARHARLVRDAKRLRKALGTRREADVMLSDFRILAEESQLPASTASGIADALTRAGIEGLAAAHAKYTPKRLRKAGLRVQQALDEVERPLSWRELGAPHLYLRATAPEEKLLKMEDPEALPVHHALRVDMKRLRYATEILAEVFPDELDRQALIPRLKEMQDALGSLQDASDLLRFLDRPIVKNPTRDAEHAQLVKGARAIVTLRHRRAAETVSDIAPVLFGRLRRAAGRIGPLGR